MGTKISNEIVNPWKSPWEEQIDEWSAQTFELTENQKKLNEELLNALKNLQTYLEVYDFHTDYIYDHPGVADLKEFLNNHKGNKDLKVVLDLKRGKLESTVLHEVANFNIGAVDLLLEAGADLGIRNKEGKIPLQIAIDNHDYRVAGYLLTDSQKKLNKELHAILEGTHSVSDGWGDPKFSVNYEGVVKLKKFLEKHKGDEDLKIVLNLQNEDGKSVVEYAIDAACADWGNREKYQEIIKLFIDAKADINLKDNAGRTLLHCIAMDGREVAAKFLLTSIKDKVKAKLINAQDDSGNIPLHYAAQYSGCSDMVELLLKHGARWDIKNNEQDTALHLSCFKRDDKGIEAFLKMDNLGLDINVKDGKGATPLLIAALHGSVNTVELLLEKGADVHEQDNHNNSVLHYAVRSEYDDTNEIGMKHRDASEAYYVNTTRDNCSIISSLIYKGAPINAKNKHGNTPLFSAVEAVESFPIDKEGNKYEVIELFLENDADINVVDKNGFTVFHFAVKQRSLDMLKIFLSKKTERNKYDFPVTDEKGNPIGEIDEKKAKELLGVIDKEGNTLLHHAVKWGCSEKMLNFLVKSGVDINAKNNNGVAPIHIAAKYGKPNQMEFFIKNKADLNIKCGNLSKSVIDSIGKEKELSSNNYINVQNSNVDVSSTVDIKDNTEHKKATAVSIATQGSSGSAVTTLLSGGAKPSIEDSRGWLPLHIAIKRACDKDCKEEERQEKYEIIRNLASVSDVEFLMSGIDKKSKTYKNQFFGKIKDSLQDALVVANNDKVQRKIVDAFHDVMLQVTRDEEEIKKILEDAIASRNGEKSPTAPISEEASAPLFDDNFYNEIGSHVKKPILYPDLSDEPADDESHWGTEFGWNNVELVNQQTSTQWEDDGWGDVDDGRDFDDGTYAWHSPANKSLDNLTNELEGQKNISKKIETPKSSLKLTFDQRTELSKFLNRTSKVQDIVELNQVVDEALKSGVRLNLFQDKKYNFTNSVIQKIYELNSVKKNPKIASDIMRKLVSKGVIFGQDYNKINDELEKVFKDHKTNMKKAYLEHGSRVNEFQEAVKSAISKGELKSLEIDNTTFYLEYSQDSVVDVAKVIDAARSLGMCQGDITFGGNIVKVGDSEVEIEAKNNIRNYTDLSDNGDIVLTFYTSLGELDVRLRENKDKIEVEVSDRKKFDQLVSNNEEIGKNCLLGGYSVCDAINKGCFERSGKLQPYEALGLPKKVIEKASEIIKNLQYSDIKENSWTDTVQHSRLNREGVQI